MKRGKLLLILWMFLGPVLSAAHLSPSVQVTARCNGNNEVPVVTTTGQGLAVLTLDKKMESAELIFQATGLSGAVMGIHIHEGMAGQNGGVILDLTPYLDGDRVRTTLYFNDTLTLKGILDGSFYLNVHTEQYPNGEIRGQLKVETDLLLGGMLSGEAEVPSVNTKATGFASAVLSLDGSRLQLNVLYDSLSGPVIGAHLHLGAPGTNGAVLLDLTGAITLAGLIDLDVEIDASLATALRTGNVYVNIHTAINPGGEIRAQLEPAGIMSFDCIMNGAAEVPSVMTEASGLLQFNYDPSNAMVSFNGFIKGIEGVVTGAHLHLGGAGSNGEVIVNLSSSITGNGMVSGRFTSPDISFVQAALSGGVYLNVHTMSYPGGEIRGQITRVLREGYLAVLNGGQQVPSIQVNGYGVAMASIDRDQQIAHYMVVIDSISSAFSGAHFHQGGPGENGNVLYDLSPAMINGTAAFGYWKDLGVSAALFRTTGVYINVHTSDFPAGELRGNFIRGNSFTDYAISDPGFTGELLFTGRLAGGQQVPVNASTGVGVMGIMLDTDMKKAYVNLAVNGLRSMVTGIHLHTGIPGENGPVAVNLTNSYKGGRIQETIEVDETLLLAFMRGEVYVNVHTELFPDGEIRAQLPLEKDLSFGGWLTGGQEVPSVNTTARGLASYTLTQVLNRLEINVLTDSLSGPITGAHLHQAAPGSNGNVVADLTSMVSGGMITGVIDASSFYAALLAGDIYLNVHTDLNPGGEIRGQLDPVSGISFDGWLTGAQQVPSQTTAGIGLQQILLSPEMDQLTVRCLAVGMSAPMSAAHLHLGGIGTNGNVWLDLSQGIQGQMIDQTFDLQNLEGIRALLRGKVYLNVHSQAFPGGELRAQTLGSIRDAYNFDLCQAQSTMIEVSANSASGGAILSIDRKGTNIHLMGVSTGLTDTITGIHLHKGMMGMDGEVLIGLTDRLVNGGIFLYYQDENGDIIRTIRENAAYMNVHTMANPNGEIRGQVIRGSSCSAPSSARALEKEQLSLMIAPNPASELVRIDLEGADFSEGLISLDMLDMMGRLILHKESASLPVEISLAGLSSGQYVIRVTRSGNSGVQKLFIQ